MLISSCRGFGMGFRNSFVAIRQPDKHTPPPGDLDEFDPAGMRLPKSNVKKYRRGPLVDVGTSTNFG